MGVRAASLRGVSRSFEFVGRAKAVNKVEVRARIEGFLDKVQFTEGQDVKAGDLLYRIEKVQFQSALDQAKGNLLIAEATATHAKLEYERQLDLVKRQYAPQSVLDKDKADLDSANGTVMQARAASSRPRPTSTTPTFAARSTAASAAPPTPRAISSTRRVASWQRSSARIRSMCSFRSA